MVGRRSHRNSSGYPRSASLPWRSRKATGGGPWFAAAGAVYLAHIWFISVFSINIFLELYGKNRSDFCKLDSHEDLLCGVREPWIADVFNAIPWVMTGVLMWICIYFIGRGLLIEAWGTGFTVAKSRQLLVGAPIISSAATVTNLRYL